MEVMIQEGIEPIVYSWSNGATTSKVLNLTPGTYSVTVTDAKGNTLTLSESISSSPPIVISETITNPYCSGAASGVIELNVSGGSGGYTFLWSNGMTQQNIMNLSSGLYTVTVTDSTGMFSTKNFHADKLNIDQRDVDTQTHNLQSGYWRYRHYTERWNCTIYFPLEQRCDY